ncbi:MAG: VWA domain-containing protein [Spirochaetota bacterium]|nr:VWA domain-containing protein [Spirochaetota bacterium]
MNKKIIIIFLIIFFGTSFIYSQRINASSIKIRIEQSISKLFPNLKVYVSAVNNENEPVLSLVRGNFSAFVDGKPLESKVDISGFQYSEEGIAYSLLIAANGMMDGEPLDRQLKAATVLLEALREQDRLSIYTFGEEVSTIFEFKKKGESLLNKISSVKVLGKNPHLYDALVYVIRRFDDTELDRKVVVVMSDGREKGSKYSKNQLLKIVDEKNIAVYSIGLKIMAGQNLYRIAGISSHTGGGYLYSGNLWNLPVLMATVIKQIQQGYILNFDINNIEADNQIHQLQIKVNHRGKEATSFKNFIATKVPISFWKALILIIITLLVIGGLVYLFIVFRRKRREMIGISKRKCPVCKRRMKEDWDECRFCKYLPPKEKKKWFKKKSD